ncbi:TonB-dependent receptor [Sphingomonas bacterium]|uniref:TonB-dependent receptor n=1 Tax=Sphingomonas bacterium TaxID=1895847 RepID=UPI001576216D|nr:TonB-dependent receptor [Sphingomonas bacterium]
MSVDRKGRLLASAAALVIAAPAVAQTAQPATPPVQPATPGTASDATGAVASSEPTADAAQTTPSAGSLEDIVVTATRRTVNLQRVTATVEAVTGNTLKAFNVTSVVQLPSLVSGLVVTPAGGNNLYLRGIGSASTGFNEAQVASYIDGLYLANPTASITSFNNVERIEVLKGPQGTLYGRNATGGLISVTTRDPGDKTRVDGSIGYANYNTLTANLYVSTPLTDNLAINIAGFHQKQADGWTTNVFNGHDVQKSNENGLETKLQWKPTSDLKITGSFIYDYNNRDIGYAYQVYPGSLGTDGTPYLGKYKIASRIDASAPTSIYIGTLRIEQNYGFATLTSLTGYQTSQANVLFQNGLPILGQVAAGQGASYNQFFERNRTFSQELTLTSTASPSSRFDWVAGAFYYDDHLKLQLDTYNTCIGNVCAPGTVPNRINGLPSTLSGSVYGDGTIRILDATRLTIGLRYTDEAKTLAGLTTPLPGQPNSVAVLPASTILYPGQPFAGYPNGIPTRLHFDRLTYRVVLAQDLGEDIHVYASHNLGFKSGAFNANAFTNPPVRPELLYATEAGVKSELFDRRLRINAAYFHYTYKDVQVRSLVPPATTSAILENAASEHVDGVDVDFSAALFKGFAINGSFEYLDARYAAFPGASLASPKASATGVLLPGATIINNYNLAGFDVPFAAPVSASLGATYTFDTARGTFSLSANDHYNSPYSMTVDGSIRQGRHDLVDLSLNWTAPDKRYDVNLFVRNLTDQYTYAAAVVSSNFAVVPGAPRTFGGSLGFHF